MENQNIDEKMTVAIEVLDRVQQMYTEVNREMGLLESGMPDCIIESEVERYVKLKKTRTILDAIIDVSPTYRQTSWDCIRKIMNCL